jgi:hypothetical protein
LIPLVQGGDSADDGHYSNPESTPLYLPSSLPSRISQLPELKVIREAEHRLREAQADDALANVRHLRRVIQGLWQFKKLNVSGTGNRPNTRMLSLWSRFDTKLQQAANRYNVAYTALKALDQNGTWKDRLKELKPSDLRGPGRDSDNPEDAKTNGRFEPSWIWLVARLPQERGENQTEDEFNHSMRTEWAQTRARMCRWKEELLIVQEEMRRVLAYFEWRSSWWLEQGNRRTNLDSSLQSGLVAYAHKQSTLCLRMAARCATYWLPVMKKHGIIPKWGGKYQTASSAVKNGDSSSDSEEEEPEWGTDNRSDAGELNVDDILDFD